MSKRRQLIMFFEQFEANLNAAILCDEGGAQAAATAFAGEFVQSGPDGVRCVRNDDAFVRALAEQCAFYQKAGTRSLRLEGIDSSPLDAHHVTARIHWVGEFARPEGGIAQIPFETVCFVRIEGSALHIIGYLAGSERDALQEHGILA